MLESFYKWYSYSEERFLLHKNGPNVNERVLIFATNSELSLFANFKTWFTSTKTLDLYRNFFNNFVYLEFKKIQFSLRLFTVFFCVKHKMCLSCFSYSND